jgi:DNA replication protein DnaC
VRAPQRWSAPCSSNGGCHWCQGAQNGINTLFIDADDLYLVDAPEAGQCIAGLDRARYLSIPFLIIDELGFQAPDRRGCAPAVPACQLPLRLIEHHMTSNKSITGWPAMLATMRRSGAAILDRLLHGRHVVQSGGAELSVAEKSCRT